MLSIGTLISSIATWITETTGSPEGVSVWLSILSIAVAGGLVTTAVIAIGWRYKALVVRNREIRFTRILLPRMPRIGFLSALRIPTPKFRFNLSGWRGIASSVGIVTVAFAVALTSVIAITDTTPIFPEEGASYELP